MTDALTPAVEASGLTYAYGDRRALDGVSFQVGRGEIFGFLGPNGSGKSTLFRLLVGLIAPAGGGVRVAGVDPTRDPLAARRRLGVVFQSPALDPHLSVRENLLHHGHLHGLRGRPLAERIAETLERFGLADRAGDRAKTLSGGLARRVELAKALLHQPEILLLDEPSTGLDPRARRELWDRLEALASQGVTTLLTTHLMDEADRCNRLLLLDEGRTVAEGSPDALKEEVGPAVLRLGAPDPAELAGRIQGGIQGLEDLETTDVRALVDEGEVRIEHPAAHSLVARLAEALPGRIETMTVARPTLEDVFLRRTGRRLQTAGDSGESR